MTKRIIVTIEHMAKRSFASAADWPGWSRAGRTEDAALDALAAYAPRYAAIVGRKHGPFERTVTVEDLQVVERLEGSAGTEFGVPSRPTEHDGRRLDASAAERLADLVEAAWELLDRVAADAPEELRRGPRGGGRNTTKVIEHAREADRAYANEIGIKTPGFDVGDDAAVDALRASMLEILRAARDGDPLAGRRWPARYAAHRIAWHSLDHAWEIEDRSSPEPET